VCVCVCVCACVCVCVCARVCAFPLTSRRHKIIHSSLMQIGAGLTASSNATGVFSTRLAPNDTRLSNQSQWLVLPPGASTRPGAPQHALFRTTFSLPVGAKPGVGRARIAAALVGCGHVSLNGHRLGVDVLGSVSQLDKTVLCVGHRSLHCFKLC
jgi:hypothetical protein